MKDSILKGKTILVAEDDSDLREIIGDVLRMHGATIIDAENGSLALDLYKKNAVDLVVSDIRMPNGDGLELLDGVRAHDASGKPFLFLSGYSDLTREEAVSHGAQDVFTKPFDVFELVQRIAQLMNISID